jgi:hypothetical protein
VIFLIFLTIFSILHDCGLAVSIFFFFFVRSRAPNPPEGEQDFGDMEFEELMKRADPDYAKTAPKEGACHPPPPRNIGQSFAPFSIVCVPWNEQRRRKRLRQLDRSRGGLTVIVKKLKRSQGLRREVCVCGLPVAHSIYPHKFMFCSCYVDNETINQLMDQWKLLSGSTTTEIDGLLKAAGKSIYHILYPGRGIRDLCNLRGEI